MTSARLVLLLLLLPLLLPTTYYIVLRFEARLKSLKTSPPGRPAMSGQRSENDLFFHVECKANDEKPALGLQVHPQKVLGALGLIMSEFVGATSKQEQERNKLEANGLDPAEIPQKNILVCVCPPPFPGVLTQILLISCRGGRIHRRLVNEAGDVSEDMETGRHFHVPALLYRATEGNGSRRTCASVPFEPFLI